MPNRFQHLELVCLNIDGVLLPDTFSPVVHRFLSRFGVEYTSLLERLILSQPRMVSASILASVAGLPWTWQQVVDEYFAERDRYLADHPLTVSPGTAELLTLLRDKGAVTICYGGMDRDSFDTYLGEYRHLFAEPGYITTDRIRPGIKEIVTEYFDYRYDQVLFVDDVNRFAEFAKHLDVAFIGVPSSFEYGFQREHMRRTGVRHIVDTLLDIDDALLDQVDREAAAGTVWAEHVPQEHPDQRGQRGARQGNGPTVRGDGPQPRTVRPPS